MAEMRSTVGDQKLCRYGGLYWIEFDEETVGTEVRGSRPGLIISDNSYNKISKRVIVLPCSRTLDPLYSFELFIPKLVKEIDGKIMIDQIQCIDKVRIGNKIKDLTAEEMDKVVERLRKILPLLEMIKAKLQ
ncbi:MAG: type II toxin-antitoxin system PemK/MazF family toxin [Candidatus Moeniiplasma glomeromycotorum]|nr:type II toxin-antitoxin system PemK/MazF family toxin [Candidatus Moeniiplasma glomeromycotorum]MCE8169326.1 type II toxin-antitoxin system PemK/MazF family toxin [Candidatus Moeniiplasma glomeromycotorum]